MSQDRRAALLALKDAVVVGDDAAFRRAARAAFSTPCQDITLQLREGRAMGAYRGSMDAALALLGAVLPRVHWAIFSQTTPEFVASIIVSRPDGPDEYDGVAPTPARALLLATIKALIAQEAQP